MSPAGAVPPRKAFAPQLVREFNPNEQNRLISRIEDDYQGAMSDHDRRMRRFTRYYARWRDLDYSASLGQTERPYRVPILQWQTYGKWAKELDSLFGENAEIRAEPIGPSDRRQSQKVAHFMNWRVFQSMRIIRDASLFSFRKVLFGRSHAICRWERRTFQMPMADGTWQEAVDYDGQVFEPIWPDDLIVPAETVRNVQQFSFVIHKGRLTPNDLLIGETQGKFFGIQDCWDDLIIQSESGRERDYESERIQTEADEAEGVTRDSALSASGSLRVWWWYGRWRRLKGKRDGRIMNARARSMFESDLLVAYLPDLNKIVGIQDLAEMFPTTAQRRPIVETALVEDGSYWGPGYGELLEMIEAEMSRAHNLGAKAGAFSVGPLIFYKPESGFDPDTFEYEPNKAIPVDNPQGIQIVQLKADLEYPILVKQDLGADSERVTGQNDANLGRQSDRPNAPRTARQFIGMIEEGNVRASLDVTKLREDWRDILRWIWQLETMYGSPRTFFRATEEKANGLYEVSQGGSWMTQAERAGAYDFALKLASSAQSREDDKQRILDLYGLLLQNPFFLQDPRPLALITKRVCEALGREDVAALIPTPPESGNPMTPQEEWTRMLQGEDVPVHPDDMDQSHIVDHYAQAKDERETPGGEPDLDALDRLATHIAAHQQQQTKKQLMNALVGQMTTMLAKNIGTGQGITPGGQSMSLQTLSATLQQLTNPDQSQGAPGAPAGGAVA